MLHINNVEGFNIYYTCDCGVHGRCIVKPLSDKEIMIVNITCPVCFEFKKFKLIPSCFDPTINELSWACVISNEISVYDFKEE